MRGRSRHDVFAPADAVRYIVLWDLEWHVIECRELAAGSDLRQAFDAAITGYRADGWHAVGDGGYGFVFLSRPGERWLFALSPRHPTDSNRQTFNPFRGD